jgi:hypothetical protein
MLCLWTPAAAMVMMPPAVAQSVSTSQSADSGNSIAAAARQAKAQKNARAKKVFTDEDMEATAGPLPRLKMDGSENADDVVAAISAYRLTHTPEEIEHAVHIWYDRYDQMLAAAIQANQDVRAIRQANMSNGEDLCQQNQDYEQCQARRMVEYRGQRDDAVEIAKNTALETRIQHAFSKVRIGLIKNNLRYDWFKIRTTNGIDLY